MFDQAEISQANLRFYNRKTTENTRNLVLKTRYFKLIVKRRENNMLLRLKRVFVCELAQLHTKTLSITFLLKVKNYTLKTCTGVSKLCLNSYTHPLLNLSSAILLFFL